MINIKKLLVFVFSFFALYLLFNFLIPTLKIDKFYNQQFINKGNIVFRYMGKDAKTTFEKAPPSKMDEIVFVHPFKKYDDQVIIKTLNQRHVKLASDEARKKGQNSVNVNHSEFIMDTWRFGLIPMILIMSLILATPIPIKRRFFSLFLGLVAINLFTAFRFWIRYMTEINRHIWLDVGTLGPNMKWLVTHANTILMFQGIGLIACVLIWIVVTFRPSDVDLFIDREEEEEYEEDEEFEYEED